MNNDTTDTVFKEKYTINREPKGTMNMNHFTCINSVVLPLCKQIVM